MSKKQELERLRDESEAREREDRSRGRETLGDPDGLDIPSDRRWNGQPMYKTRRRFL